MYLLANWLINALSLLAIPYLIPSVTIDSFTTALVVAVVLGLVNAVIRPILVILTLPVTVISLGLFVFVINALMFWMVASWIEGFHVSGFWSAFGGALLYSVISWALSTVLFQRKNTSRNS
jgi:putative membrane protein